MLIVDAQIHLFGPNAQEHAKRVGQEIVDVESVVAGMDRNDVSRAYLVPAGSAGNQECLDAARRSYDEAYRKLSSGRGNAIRQAELLRNLGIKSTKSLPLAMVEQAVETPLELAAVADEELG